MVSATLTLAIVGAMASGSVHRATDPACAGTRARPAPAGVRLVVESLDLALTTPDRWRISTGSTPQELLLLSGTERSPLHLRVRRELSARLPRELMRALALELGAPYAEIEFESEETRTIGDREVILVHASGGRGQEEVHVRVCVVALSAGSRHVFWLDGSPRDVRRSLDDVLECIAGASPAAGPTGDPGGTPGGEATLIHRASGLVIERHPDGLEPRSLELDELDREGWVWALGEPDTPLAQLSLTRRVVGPVVDESTAAGSLGSELRRDPRVTELASSRERLANLPARRLTWRSQDRDGVLAHETWFFKSGSSLFRLDVIAHSDWILENQAALEGFRRGLRFLDRG